MDQINEDVKLAQQAYSAASQEDSERLLNVWISLLQARNELHRELANASTDSSGQAFWIGLLVAVVLVVLTNTWVLGRVQGWRRQNVRQLALASACYLCGRPGDEVPSQCGVFVKPYKVLCTAHGLPTNARIGTKVVAFISGAHGDDLERVVLIVSAMDKDLDWALLSSPLRRKHLKIVQKNWGDLALLNLTICSFMISVAGQGPEAYSPQFTMLPATPQVLSRHGNHLVYTSSYAEPGDSGGALLMEDGHIIGIHVEGINNLKERYRQKKDVEDRLSAVEESIDAAIAIVSQGSVALLAKAFPAL